jgi:hypothetical protein
MTNDELAGLITAAAVYLCAVSGAEKTPSRRVIDAGMCAILLAGLKIYYNG